VLAGIAQKIQGSQPLTTVIEWTAAAELLRQLIDYAGLFPPASLSMAASVANFDAYSRSEASWILGRFIVPVARLGEFEEAFSALPSSSSEDGSARKWRLSALTGSDVVADISRIRLFNERFDFRGAAIDSLEAKATNAAEIARFSEIAPPEMNVYFEIPLVNCRELIAAIAACGRRAKIRTGGEAADKFPPPGSMIEFIQLCAAGGIPFKATAGLHHPVRSVHRFTYQADSASGMMHGFVNVFLAAAFLRAGMAAEQARQLLEEQSAAAFQFAADSIGWRGHKLPVDEISAARDNFAVSFGSCSFSEPIDDLRDLHLI
jgi:hypothetical protein